MTAQEMQYNFELKIGTFHSLNKPFTSTDIAVFLNKAQEELIDSFYTVKNGRRDLSFESDEKSRLALGPVIRSTTITAGNLATGTNLHDNAVAASLPADFMYAIEEECTVLYTDCNGVTGTSIKARVLPIRHEEYALNKNNPFGKPYNKLVWRMDMGVTGARQHELIYGTDTTIDEYRLRYIKTPLAIDIIGGVDCELHESFHEEIVDMAVRIGLASLPQPQNVEQNIEQ